MILTIKKTSRLCGEIIAPPSKSHAVRDLVIATLAQGVSALHNMDFASEDIKAAVSACRAVGAKIAKKKCSCHESCVKVEGLGAPFSLMSKRIFTGNSGITTNFIMPLLGLRQNARIPVVLDCAGQMKKRPVQPLIQALQKLGMKIKPVSKKGAFPLELAGSLQGGQTTVLGIISQYASALLLSCPCAARDTKIVVKNLRERPYLGMTLQRLKEQKIAFRHGRAGGKDIFIIKGRQQYKSFNKITPGDFSSASYLIAAGVLIPGRIAIKGLDMFDSQGDKRLVGILKKMGASIVIKNAKSGQQIICRGGRTLKGIKIDCRHIPDLLPVLAVIGTFAEGKTQLLNAPQARFKETDRIRSMTIGLRKMGAKIEEKRNGLVIYKSELRGSKLHGYNDHRTVMALSVAAMLARGETKIDTAEAINKTFPNYITLMRGLGAKMELKRKA